MPYATATERGKVEEEGSDLLIQHVRYANNCDKIELWHLGNDTSNHYHSCLLKE